MRSGLSGLSKVPAFAIAGAVLLVTPAAADDFVETSGRVLMFALPVAGGGYALFKGDTQGFLQLGASVATAYGTSFLLQKVVKEERPDHSGWDSFPSDSTAIAFGAASSIQRRYGWEFGIPSYAIAAYVGYSRVEADKHHWGDVAAGAAIGVLSGLFWTSAYQKPLMMQVRADTTGAAVKMHWTF
jgi:membrane-associated phospholipid phosphatase